MKLHPLADRIVVKPAAPEEKTKGGIILPDTAKEKPVWGEVIAAGPGKMSDEGKKVPMEVKVGDKVLMPSGKTGEVIEVTVAPWGQKVVIIYPKSSC